MAYVITKGKAGRWYLRWRKDSGRAGKVDRRVDVPSSEAGSVGVFEGMGEEEARAAVARWRADYAAKRAVETRRAIRDRLEASDVALRSALPHSERFIEEYKEDIVNVRQRGRIETRWRCLLRMAKELGIPPQDWRRRRAALYQWFAKETLSLDYAQKVLTLGNRYGEYLGETSQLAFKAVPMPAGEARSVIVDAHSDAPGPTNESDPLDLPTLLSIKADLKPEQFRWLWVALWFALRPAEVYEAQGEKHGVKIVSGEDVSEASFYQPKLRFLPRDKRWKWVPVLFPEQEEALRYIKEGGMKAPLPKTLQRLTHKHITTYGPRKAFQALMLERGREIFEIWRWMGHRNIDRMWKDYMEKGRALITKKSA